jgi:enoyl-CoA hydratase
MTEPVRYQLADGIATITLDDGKANVMGLPMQTALNRALDQALTDHAVVAITGRTGMFSGGFDLNVFRTDPAASVQMLEGGARLALRLLQHPHPVMVACSGHAVAMGCFLLLGADYRLGVDHNCRIHAIEVQIGMTLPYFALSLCRQRLTPAHFSLACTTAWPYTPAQAVQAGFLDEACSVADFPVRVAERATYLAKLHREAFTATKQKLKQSFVDELEAAIQTDVVAWRDRFLKAA